MGSDSRLAMERLSTQSITARQLRSSISHSSRKRHVYSNQRATALSGDRNWATRPSEFDRRLLRGPLEFGGTLFDALGCQRVVASVNQQGVSTGKRHE